MLMMISIVPLITSFLQHLRVDSLTGLRVMALARVVGCGLLRSMKERLILLIWRPMALVVMDILSTTIHCVACHVSSCFSVYGRTSGRGMFTILGFLRALSEPEKDFMGFRKIRLANPEESRETSEFSVKPHKIIPGVKRSANKNLSMVISAREPLYFLHFLL